MGPPGSAAISPRMGGCCDNVSGCWVLFVLIFMYVFIYIFMYAALGLSCGMCYLQLQHARSSSPRPGIEPKSPALGAQSQLLDHQRSPVAAVLKCGDTCHMPESIFGFVSVFASVLVMTCVLVWGLLWQGVHFVSCRMNLYTCLCVLICEASPTGCPWNGGERLLAATR